MQPYRTYSFQCYSVLLLLFNIMSLRLNHVRCSLPLFTDVLLYFIYEYTKTYLCLLMTFQIGKISFPVKPF